MNEEQELTRKEEELWKWAKRHPITDLARGILSFADRRESEGSHISEYTEDINDLHDQICRFDRMSRA